MILPWDLMLMLARDYFHPPEALIALRICKRLNQSLDHERIHRAMLIHVEKVIMQEEVERSNSAPCHLCHVEIWKSSMHKHLEKHRRYKEQGRDLADRCGVTVETCKECGILYVTRQHSCPLSQYECHKFREDRIREEHPWVDIICLKAMWYKREHRLHTCFARCQCCGGTFELEKDEYWWEAIEACQDHEKECPAASASKQRPTSDEIIRNKSWE